MYLTLDSRILRQYHVAGFLSYYKKAMLALIIEKSDLDKRNTSVPGEKSLKIATGSLPPLSSAWKNH